MKYYRNLFGKTRSKGKSPRIRSTGSVLKPSSTMEVPKEKDNVHIHADFSFYEVNIRSGGCSEQGLQWSKQLINSRKEIYFAEAMLLKSLEKEPTFPCIGITFWNLRSVCPVVGKIRPLDDTGVRTDQPSSSRDETELRNCDISRFGCYEEEGSIGKDGVTSLPKRPTNPNSVYYMICFKTQGNALDLTKTWRTWTGADFILWKCPKDLNLQRVSFYKHLKPSADDIMFVLLIECSEGLSHQQAAFHFLERLRDRRCGHVGIYHHNKLY